MNAIKNKCSEAYWYSPSEMEKESLEDPKAALEEPPILELPKQGRLYMIYTDESSPEIGETIMQQQEKENRDIWSTLGFWSKKLTDTERRYQNVESEFLSVV